MCGKTAQGSDTGSSKLEAVNRETRSCQCCSVLGIHDSLCEVRNRLRREDTFFAYFDDVHVSSPPTCGAQIASRFWGTSIGSPEFVHSFIEKRLEDEQRLWEAVTWVPDLQSAWQILLQCAGPRCHHLLRTLPPSQSTEYAQHHDDGMWQALGRLLVGLTGTEEEKLTARHLASLPMRLGGLGLRSASRMAPAAFWSSWADALQMIHERLPQVAHNVVEGLNGVREVEGCIRELHDSAVELDRHGFVGRPAWADLVAGVRPPPANVCECGAPVDSRGRHRAACPLWKASHASSGTREDTCG